VVYYQHHDRLHVLEVGDQKVDFLVLRIDVVKAFFTRLLLFNNIGNNRDSLLSMKWRNVSTRGAILAHNKSIVKLEQ
jgi:hypothetical protein